MNKTNSILSIAVAGMLVGCSQNHVLPDGRVVPKSGFGPTQDVRDHARKSGLMFDGVYYKRYSDGLIRFIRFWPNGRVLYNGRGFGTISRVVLNADRFSDKGIVLGTYVFTGSNRIRADLTSPSPNGYRMKPLGITIRDGNVIMDAQRVNGDVRQFDIDHMPAEYAGSKVNHWLSIPSLNRRPDW